MRARLLAAVLIAAAIAPAAQGAAASPASLAAPAAAAPAAAAPHPSRCLPPGARTLAVDRYARVFRLPGREGLDVAGRVYACLFARGVYVPLVRGYLRSAEEIVLSGRLVAFGEHLMGVDTGDSNVVERDLASGRVLSLQAATGTGLPESFYSVQRLLLAPRGALAWVSRSSSVVSQGVVTYEVHAALPRGSTAVLDRGPAIEARSLGLSETSSGGAALTWRDGTRAMSGSLR